MKACSPSKLSPSCSRMSRLKDFRVGGLFVAGMHGDHLDSCTSRNPLHVAYSMRLDFTDGMKAGTIEM